MFANYLKIAFRNLRKHKAYSLINIFGLSTGVACALVILFFIRYELSYDRFHANAHRTFRLTMDTEGFGRHANAPPPLAPAIIRTYPEIERAARVFRHWRSPLIVRDRNAFIENEFFYVDQELLQIFSLPLLRGDPSTALTAPLSVIITERMAEKYFGDSDPVGQTIMHNTKLAFTVTGVLRNPPQNMHFHPDFLASFSSLPQIMWPSVLETWSLGAIKTYVTLKENVPPAEFGSKIRDFYPTHRDPNSTDRIHLQPLTDIHLYSDLSGEIEPNSDIRYVYLLSVIGILLLAIACINYINLTTARASMRAREVGLRKVVGADRATLITQFLGESIVLTLVSITLAVVMIELFIPILNAITGRGIASPQWGDPLAIGGVLFIALALGVIAGSYPAFVIAGFQPIHVLKGKLDGQSGHMSLRKVLVAGQFCASVALIFSTIVILQQTGYVRSAKLGFNKDQVVVIPLRDGTLAERIGILTTELQRVPGVLATAAANSYPGRGYPSDDVRWEGAADNQSVVMTVGWIDERFLNALDIQLVAGRNFSSGLETDWTDAALVNERAVAAIGIQSPEDAIGKRIYPAGTDTKAGRRVIGVMKDFNFKSLHHAIEPIIFIPQRVHLSYLVIRLDPNDLSGTLSALRDKWTQVSNVQPFSYSFLDREFDRLYQSEERWSQTMASGATLAVSIACLGLLGLASFMTERRTREIGIRKVLGASAASVIRLLSMDFLRLVLLANVIALPVAWYEMDLWLQDFAYRVQIGVWTPVITCSLALVLAITTVGVQALKAAMANPVDTLRHQ